jgi:hypothetical protein
MRRAFPVLVAAAAMLAGCATPIAPVEVTRFHRLDATSAMAAATATPGSYRIVLTNPDAPNAGGGAGGLEWDSYAAAVARQLDLMGYTAVAPDAAQGSEVYRVTLSVERGERIAAPARSPVSVGVGGSTGSYGSGVGVGVGINLGNLIGGGNREIIGTRIEVRLTRSGDTLPLWEGRAQTEVRSGTPAAQPGLAAQKLAEALFGGFPGRSGETITVP